MKKLNPEKIIDKLLEERFSFQYVNYFPNGAVFVYDMMTFTIEVKNKQGFFSVKRIYILTYDNFIIKASQDKLEALFDYLWLKRTEILSRKNDRTTKAP